MFVYNSLIFDHILDLQGAMNQVVTCARHELPIFSCAWHTVSRAIRVTRDALLRSQPSAEQTILCSRRTWSAASPIDTGDAHDC